MRRRIVALVVVSFVGGWRCIQAEDGNSAANAESYDTPAMVLEDRELPAVLRAAGRSTGELAGYTSFKRALELLRSGEHQAAVRAFDETARHAAGLADWATYFAAYAAAGAGDTVTAMTRVQSLDAEFRRIYAWRARTHAFEKAGQPARALAVAHSAAANIQGPRRFEPRVEAARLLVAQGDSARGRAHLNAAIDSGSTPTRVKAAALLETLGPTPDEWLRIARAQRAAGRNTDALTAYTKAGTPTAQLERAQVLFTQRKYAATVTQLEDIFAGTGSIAADARLLRARAQLRLGEVTNARTNLLAVADNAAATPLARAGAAYMLGDLAQDAGQPAEARTWFRAAINAMPGSEPAAQAFMRLGTDAFMKDAHAQAVAIFDEFARAHAQTNYAQQALFWSARAHADAQDRARARSLMSDVITLDQFSYYGLLAGEWLGLPATVLNQGPATADEVQQQARGSLRRAQLLESAQLTEALSYEQERARAYLATRSGGLHFLAEELQKQGRIAESITLGRRLHNADGRWNARTLRLIYPFPYRATIEKHAQTTGLSPHLMAALIRQESMFNPRAKSAAGAVGLMQVMPRTGRSVAARIGIKRFTPAQLTNPETNVRIGAAHFRNLLKEYDGQLAHVIAAYNAGATPVSRWRNAPHARDAQLFSERIPYAETREYVKILTRNTLMYELLYPEPGERNSGT